VLAIALWIGEWAVSRFIPIDALFREEIALAVLVIAGGLAYGGAVVALFGRQILAAFRRKASAKTPAAPPPIIE
jgi:hypothetical protein